MEIKTNKANASFFDKVWDIYKKDVGNIISIKEYINWILEITKVDESKKELSNKFNKWLRETFQGEKKHINHGVWFLKETKSDLPKTTNFFIYTGVELLRSKGLTNAFAEEVETISISKAIPIKANVKVKKINKANKDIFEAFELIKSIGYSNKKIAKTNNNIKKIIEIFAEYNINTNRKKFREVSLNYNNTLTTNVRRVLSWI